MPRNYRVGEENRKQFAAAYVLDKMVNRGLRVPVMLEGVEQDLEPVLEYMFMKDLVEIRDNERYVPTARGKKELERFAGRYREFLANFDVFCAVDLAEGVFAFARYFDFDDDRQWRDYIQAERWDDLRVAVAEYKQLDPVEIVFMSFLQENRFGETEAGWQFDLLLGSVWDEILEICNTAISVNDLSYRDEDGVAVSGEAVIRDVISQGAELNAELRVRERKLRSAQGSGTNGRNDLDQQDLWDPDPDYLGPAWA
jgi:hypothetical protein